ncbi:Gfo/Idh/MocA family oxidoreductase [Leptospira sp. 201903074]|uniref:Gfo/Idh/MocA family protein n=1 Tax=Leptospira abararensis TaxID=2810036 RepID=UPI0019642526|nr:Gfo/Idh/MocA family oxidoreductase [Leptospira abararensis]MBM9548581.1 Gfo/Idh/MocA family oxidoreductase [Leptospira abararensis]
MSNEGIKKTKGMRVAVIGLGRMGVRHLQAVTNLEMEVCGIADVSEEVIASVSKEYKLADSIGFTDANVMLKNVKPTALVIATTAPFHCDYVCAAAELGVKYILCEKPMAVSLEEVERMRSSCDKAGSILAINHQMRFMPQYTQVKALIQDGDRLGPLSSIIVAGSNFGLAMNASHYFEMFRYMTDTNVETIQAWFEEGQLPNPRGPQFEDRSGRLLAKNHLGTSMYIDFSSNSGYGLQLVYICRNGQILVDELTGDLRISARKAEFRELPTSRYGMPVDIINTQIEPADTVVPTVRVWNALLDGQPFPDGEAGAHAIACLVAAHSSHENGGTPVAINSSAISKDKKFNWA